MSIGTKLLLIGAGFGAIAQVGGVFAETAILASGLADYLQDNSLADSATVRGHICHYLGRSALIKAVWLALPWLLLIVALTRSKTETTEKDRHNP